MLFLHGKMKNSRPKFCKTNSFFFSFSSLHNEVMTRRAIIYSEEAALNWLPTLKVLTHSSPRERKFVFDRHLRVSIYNDNSRDIMKFVHAEHALRP